MSWVVRTYSKQMACHVWLSSTTRDMPSDHNHYWTSIPEDAYSFVNLEDAVAASLLESFEHMPQPAIDEIGSFDYEVIVAAARYDRRHGCGLDRL